MVVTKNQDVRFKMAAIFQNSLREQILLHLGVLGVTLILSRKNKRFLRDKHAGEAAGRS